MSTALVLVEATGAAPTLLALARALADRVVALSVIVVPAGGDVSEAALPAQARRTELAALVGRADVRTLVRVGESLWSETVEAAAETGADLLVVDERAASAGSLDPSLAHAPCDVLVASAFDPERVRRILVPARGGPHAEHAAAIGQTLARRWGATTTLLFQNDKEGAYLQLLGSATVIEDRERLKSLYTAVQRTWFPDGVDDPHITLLRFDATSASYWDGHASWLKLATGFAKSIVTGSPGTSGNAGVAELP